MVHQIAIVEDDIDQQGNYADALQRRGYETLCYASVDEAMAGISANPPSLVLLDVVLGDHPDGGFDICRGLLNQGIDTPVVFLSDRTEEIDRAFGLRIAWDYLTKPISLMLLAERIANVLRISTARQNNTDPIPPCASETPIQIDRDRYYVTWRGDRVPLTLSECRLLDAIVTAGPEGISYDKLCGVTQQKVVTNNSINTHILHIRNKFKMIDPDFSHIQNRPGFGYRWLIN